MPSPRYAAFIFDMDGTLIDNMPIHARIWVEFLAELGIRTDPRAFHERTAGKNNAEILRLYLGANTSDDLIQTYSTEKEIRYRAFYRDRLQPIPGAVEFIKKTHQAGIPLALATSADLNNIHFVLEPLQLHAAFDVMVNGDEVQRSKPDPEIFQIAALRLGIAPERCLVFEDSHGGIQAAQSAGMQVIALTTSLSVEDALNYSNVRCAIADYTSLNPLEWAALPTNR